MDARFIEVSVMQKVKLSLCIEKHTRLQSLSLSGKWNCVAIFLKPKSDFLAEMSLKTLMVLTTKIPKNLLLYFSLCNKSKVLSTLFLSVIYHLHWDRCQKSLGFLENY